MRNCGIEAMYPRKQGGRPLVTLAELYKNLKATFRSAGIEDYRFEVNCIIEDIFHHNVATLYSVGKQPVPDEILEKIRVLTEKRLDGVPLQYLLGEWEFYGYPFYVGEGVLIPRPDTETLVEAVLNRSEQGNTVLDLCSGSGCIAVALKKEKPSLTVYAVEKSPFALEYLRKNTVRNEADITVVEGDVLDEETLANLPTADIIVSNPPYLTEQDMKELQKEVTFEPEMALLGGTDGLHFYREITAKWRSQLNDGGILAFEIGMGQENDVSEILVHNGFADIEILPDLAGIFRVVLGRKMK